MTATGARLLAWARRNLLLIATTLAATGFVAFMVVSTFRLYDERQARTEEIENLARQNCEGINGSNDTLRFLLDGTIRGRTPNSPPLSDAARQLTLDTYRRLPQTDCTTGAKTYFDPPFPK